MRVYPARPRRDRPSPEKRPRPRLAPFRDPVPAGLPDHGAGAGHHPGNHRFHAQARCEGNPWLRRQGGAETSASRSIGKTRRTPFAHACTQGRRRRIVASQLEGVTIMIDWFVQTLRSYPEIAIFLSLALGYYFGSFTYKGLGLGAVTATLIAAVIIGQLEIKIGSPLKPTFSLMFLFGVGYGVGPQFVRGIAQDGLPQALFAVVVCFFCLGSAYLGAKLAGYDVGSATGLYAGSQTISASMGLATDAIGRLGLPPEESKKLLDAMPVAYAVTYIFGTIGSAIVLALLGPALLGIDLETACRRYEEKHGGKKEAGGPGTAWHQFELRAFRVKERGPVVGKTGQQVEAVLPDQRVFVQRIRRGDQILEATADTVIHAGDVVALAGRREVLVNLVGSTAEE